MTTACNDNTIDEIISPHGVEMTLDDLPPVNTCRWVISRKAAVVTAVTCGLISLKEACDTYALSLEEFQSWQKAMDQNGISGLRATRLQHYR